MEANHWLHPISKIPYPSAHSGHFGAPEQDPTSLGLSKPNQPLSVQENREYYS